MTPQQRWSLAITATDVCDYWNALFHLDELQEHIGLGNETPDNIPPAHLLAAMAEWVHTLANEEE